MSQQKEKDWIEYIVDKIYRNYKGRKVILWGKYDVSDIIAEKLKEKHRICIAFYVDSDSSKIDNKQVFSPNCLDNNSSKYYVVIPLAFYSSIKGKLIGGGYKPDIDYYYFSDCVLKMTEDYYEDVHGNKFIGKRDGIKFCFSGWNSTIIIGKNVQFDSKLELYMHNENVFEVEDGANIIVSLLYFDNFKTIKIGKNVNLTNCYMEIGENAELVIEDDVKFEMYHCFNRIQIQSNGRLRIGKKSTISLNCNLLCVKNTEIIIGEDCMFSWGVNMISNDAHTIFDIITRKPMNISEENYKRKIEIKDHVWIGMNCNILYDTYIGEGSIIGAGSLVKGRYPNNCIAAGNIAKVIKRDISWCRTDGEKNIELCGKYINSTK